jgi:RNA polymerase sigma factor (TIGR02999 family)
MSILSRQHITQKLQAWSEGDKQALDELLPIVYDELHRQASRYLRRERPDHTIQTTALINEVYIKLIEQKEIHWQNRAHFFGIAARLMRQILIDHARTKHREKRGGDDLQIPLEEVTMIAVDNRDFNLLALDEALTRLAVIDEQQSRVVELRYFGGLSIEETAKALHISTATVKRDWQMAKAWLHHELTKQRSKGVMTVPRAVASGSSLMSFVIFNPQSAIRNPQSKDEP